MITPRHLTRCFVCLVAMPTLTLAQQISDPLGGVRPAPLGTVVVTAPQQMAREVSEDLEIFRRILHQEVQRLYPPRTMSSLNVMEGYGGMMGAYGGFGGPTDPFAGTAGPIQLASLRAPLATWIPGSGVVFQMEAPPLAPPVEPSGSRPAAECPFMSQPLWKRTQMELSGEIKQIECKKCHDSLGPKLLSYSWPNSHGDSATDGDRTFSFYVGFDRGTDSQRAVARKTAPNRDELVKSLLDLLAENGHNFRHLGPNETVTISVTFTGNRNPLATWFEQIRPGLEGRAETMRNWSEALGSQGGPEDLAPVAKQHAAAAQVYLHGMSLAGQPEGMEMDPIARAANSGRADPSNPGPVELSGDLHLRQGSASKAIEAYKAALAELGKITVPSDSQTEIRAIEAQRQIAAQRLSRKLLQAYVTMGQLDEARRMIERLAQLSGPKPTPSSKERTAKSYELPARLVISVPMEALLAVAKDQKTRDEFRKSARVQWIDPTEQISGVPSKPTTAQ